MSQQTIDKALAWTNRQPGQTSAVCHVLDLLDVITALRAGQGWQPIETCPAKVIRALLYWPTFKLNEDFEQSDIRIGEGLVAESFRVGGTQWETDMVTEHLEDEAGFGYGDPTHWMPLPLAPK